MTEEKDSKAEPQEKQAKLIKRADHVAFTTLLSAIAGLILMAVSHSQPGGVLELCSAILLFIVPIICVIAAYSLLARACKSKMGSLVAGLAIIYLFAAILLPASSNARDDTRNLRCRSRLKTLEKAITMYADDNSGYLPDPERWCDLLIENYNNVNEGMFRCPEVEQGQCHYCFNENLRGMKLQELPERTVILFDSTGGWNLHGGSEKLEFRHNYSCHIYHSGQQMSLYFGAEGLVRKPLRWEP